MAAVIAVKSQRGRKVWNCAATRPLSYRQLKPTTARASKADTANEWLS